MKKTQGLIVLFFTLFVAASFQSCKEDSVSPISIKDQEDNTIQFWYPNNTAYTISLAGGDGQYSVISENPDIAQVQLISDIDMQIKPLKLGKTRIKIQDQSGNSLEIHVNIDYRRNKVYIKKVDVVIQGDLSQEEKQAIYSEAIQTIPVQMNGGYEFIEMNYVENEGSSGTVLIYPEQFGTNGVENTYEAKLGVKTDNNESSYPIVYYVVIRNETRAFLLGTINTALRSNTFMISENRNIGLYEDLTHLFKSKYPQVKSVFSIQLIGKPN